MLKRLAFASALSLMSGCTTASLLPIASGEQSVGYPQTSLAGNSIAAVPVVTGSVPRTAVATTSSISSSLPYDEANDPIFRSAMTPPASQAFEEKLERKADGTIRLPAPAQIPVIDTSGTYAALAAGREAEVESAAGAAELQ